MTDGLAFNVVRWLERSHGSPAEREAFGELEIRLGDVVLTELADPFAATVRPVARVSILHVGTWLAANWWRLRWEPLLSNPDPDWRLAHQLGGAGGGFAWPDLQFAADGPTILVCLHSTPNAGVPVRYLQHLERTIPVSAFERAVDDMMALLLERLAARRSDVQDLSDAWSAIRQERDDPAVTARRRREALLGLDPDAITEQDLASLASSGGWMGAAALEETMAVARAAEIRAVIGMLKTWSLESAPELDFAAMDPIRQNWCLARRSFEQPWEQGAALAGLAREKLGIGPDDPVPQDRFAQLMGHNVTIDRTDGGALAAGFRLPASAHRVKFRGIRRHSTSRRFEAARLLAEFLDGPAEDALLPITDAATARQKVQRAFAQEFLCPVDALQRMLSLPSPSDAQLEDAAHLFDVSELTVRSALVNRGLVDRRLLPACRRS